MNETKLIDTLAKKAFLHATEANGQKGHFSKLLTETEKIKIGRRLLIAQAILAGKTRMEVNEKLSVSPNTFAQINRWLETELNSYNSAYNPPKENRKNISRHTRPFSYEQLKKTYPTHFLLFSLFEELQDKK